jgi:hypothetical protein
MFRDLADSFCFRTHCVVCRADQAYYVYALLEGEVITSSTWSAVIRVAHRKPIAITLMRRSPVKGALKVKLSDTLNDKSPMVSRPKPQWSASSDSSTTSSSDDSFNIRRLYPRRLLMKTTKDRSDIFKRRMHRLERSREGKKLLSEGNFDDKHEQKADDLESPEERKHGLKSGLNEEEQHRPKKQAEERKTDGKGNRREEQTTRLAGTQAIWLNPKPTTQIPQPGEYYLRYSLDIILILTDLLPVHERESLKSTSLEDQIVPDQAVFGNPESRQGASHQTAQICPIPTPVADHCPSEQRNFHILTWTTRSQTEKPPKKGADPSENQLGSADNTGGLSSLHVDMTDTRIPELQALLEFLQRYPKGVENKMFRECSEVSFAHLDELIEPAKHWSHRITENRFLDDCKVIVELFLPPTSPHPLVKKFWGAVAQIILSDVGILPLSGMNCANCQ